MPEIIVKIRLDSVPRSDRERVIQLLFRELHRVGVVSDGGGGDRMIDAWVDVEDASKALIQLQAIVAGRGLADRAQIRIRPKTAVITVEHDGSPLGEKNATLIMNDLAAMIDEREIGENLATGFIGWSIVVSLYVHNPEVAMPVIEGLIEELEIRNWVERLEVTLRD